MQQLVLAAQCCIKTLKERVHVECTEISYEYLILYAFMNQIGVVPCSFKTILWLYYLQLPLPILGRMHSVHSGVVPAAALQKKRRNTIIL